MALKTKTASPGTSVDDLELLTETQLARLFGCTSGHLRNSRVQGTLELPYIKLGTGPRASVRYRLRDANLYLDQRTVFNTRQARDMCPLNIAGQVNDSSLALDEISECDPREVAAINGARVAVQSDSDVRVLVQALEKARVET